LTGCAVEFEEAVLLEAGSRVGMRLRDLIGRRSGGDIDVAGAVNGGVVPIARTDETVGNRLCVQSRPPVAAL